MSKNIKSEEILDILFEGVYALDLDRKIIFWNQAAEKITGYSKEEVLGKSCGENILIHVDKNGRNLCSTNCPAAACMSNRQVVESKLYLHHKEGYRVPVSIRVRPLLDDNNQIVGSMEVFVDTTPYESCRQQLEEAIKDSLIDSLTKLPNRRYLDNQLDAKIVELERLNNPFGVLMMDLDHFKNINDSYGHNTGDDVLKMVSKTLSGASRPYDIVGRWGGEEFVSIIPNANMRDLYAIAERYRNLVAQSVIQKEGEAISVTISIGGVIARKGEDKSRIIDRADDQLYKSKIAGRNQGHIDKK